MHDVSIKSGVNNAYSDNIRQDAMRLQSEAGVSSSNVQNVIRIVAKHVFDHQIKEPLPSKQTSLDMNREGLVISNIQATEKILKSDSVTLHVDGTSRDHKKILKAWVEKLFPNTATVTESRVTHRITSLLKQIEQGAKASLFLERVDFHELPQALSNLGLNRLQLTGAAEFHGAHSSSITNDVIIQLDKFRNNERLPPVFVRKWVRVLCAPLCTNLTDSMVRSKVEKVLKHQKFLSNRKKT
ncbi:hypothetical protein PoB_004604000 [Plakobranchus ocellatus]|uniref:Uncharacterized protein n=1 Tax=Plakobranchus ocellatus TaxID=259542 RepID=A0AAV4BJ65_9GAST|nr:hypothetical protein PoB_004604000 [Plakobranchus ocellatus]